MFPQEDEVSRAARGGTTSFRDELCCPRGFPLKGALARWLGVGEFIPGLAPSRSCQRCPDRPAHGLGPPSLFARLAAPAGEAVGCRAPAG